ncbi:MAG: glycosyltransferase [Pseudomonadota bacterium]
MPTLEHIPHVTHLSQSAGSGGAAIAAMRLLRASVAAGQSADMIVAGHRKETLNEGGVRVTTLPFKRSLRRTIGRKRNRALLRADTRDEILSLGLIRSGRLAAINALSDRILNLHWINFDTISIREIGRIRHPLVWTLHDMWAFSGAVHYSEDPDWRTGYSTRPRDDLDRRVWREKQRAWCTPMQIVTPSRWLADCVRQSALMSEWPVEVIPNAIDLSIWAPMPQVNARAALGVPPDAQVIAFGAMGGDSDPRKGFTYLQDALNRLRSAGREVTLLIFGSDRGSSDLPFTARYMGVLDDPDDLRRVYAAADVFALPSRQDNLPNVGVEALACGTPIVGFDIGGLPDLVPSRDVGALAKPFDAGDLAAALAVVLDRQRGAGAGSGPSAMAQAARAHAAESYAAPIVAANYANLYERVFEGTHRDAY